MNVGRKYGFRLTARKKHKNFYEEVEMPSSSEKADHTQAANLLFPLPLCCKSWSRNSEMHKPFLGCLWWGELHPSEPFPFHSGDLDVCCEVFG